MRHAGIRTVMIAAATIMATTQTAQGQRYFSRVKLPTVVEGNGKPAGRSCSGPVQGKYPDVEKLDDVPFGPVGSFDSLAAALKHCEDSGNFTQCLITSGPGFRNAVPYTYFESLALSKSVIVDYVPSTPGVTTYMASCSG